MCAEVDLARAGAPVAREDPVEPIVCRGASQIAQIQPGQGAAFSPELVGWPIRNQPIEKRQRCPPHLE